MNFLAHIYLSGDDQPLMAGNFMADGVKGSRFSHYPEAMQRGILLHRFIDSFTDQHEVTRRGTARLQPYFRKYSGVVTDLYYDHFLARNWLQFDHRPLAQYSQEMYAILRTYLQWFPDKPQHMLPYMIQHDWLTSYAQVEGIAQALNGMARRTTFESNMEQGGEILLKYYSDFEKDFEDFFPTIEAAAKKFLEELPTEE